MDRIEQIRKRLKATVAMEATQVDSEKFWNHAYTDIVYLLKRLDEAVRLLKRVKRVVEDSYAWEEISDEVNAFLAAHSANGGQDEPRI